MLTKQTDSAVEMQIKSTYYLYYGNVYFSFDGSAAFIYLNIGILLVFLSEPMVIPDPDSSSSYTCPGEELRVNLWLWQ